MNSLAPLNRARAGLGKVAEARRGAEESISLGHSFGELGMALQGAAAVSMHLGDGADALLLADQVIARAHEVGAADAEATVLRTLALCQLGRIDEAVATVETLTVDEFPFGWAARAVVRALSGDTAGALEDADAVELINGASYFDLALARLGGVLAVAASDDAEERRKRLDALSSIATSAGDVVFVGIGKQLSARCDGRPLEGAPDIATPPLRDGWMRIIDASLPVG